MVTSVNNQTGDVVLGASDIGAVDTTIYNTDKSNLLAQITSNSTSISNLNIQINNNYNNIGSLQTTVNSHAQLIANLAVMLNAMTATTATVQDVIEMDDPD